MVVITGTNFSGATGASFGGVSAKSFTIDSDNQITAVVYGGANGSVSVNTPGGTAVKSGFTFIQPPSITSFQPVSGGSGTTVVITGTYLSGVTAVSFGGMAAASFTVDSDTQITAVVGNGTSGAVSVTTLGGTASLSGFIFVPAITSSENMSIDASVGPQLTFIAPDNISGWNLVVTQSNTAIRTMNVFSNTNWQVTIQDNNSITDGYFTEYSSGGVYSNLQLSNPLVINASAGNGTGNSVDMNAGGIIATGTPPGQDILNGGDLRTLTFSQVVVYTDPPLSSGYSYHIVITFTASNSSY